MTVNLTGRLLGYFEPGLIAWHQARQGRIGASDIGIICGWSPYNKTRADLLAEKRGDVQPQAMSKAMARGHYLEPAVAAWFADETGANYLMPESGGTYVHPDLDWMLVNPDRICSDGSLLEIKTAKEKSQDFGWGRQGTDQIPLLYQAQCQWALHALGLKLCHVAVLFGAPFQFCKYQVRYDAEVADYLIAHGSQFYADMTAPDESEAA